MKILLNTRFYNNHTTHPAGLRREKEGNNMNEKKIQKLYELLERAEKEKDAESAAALRCAIFTLEQAAG